MAKKMKRAITTETLAQWFTDSLSYDTVLRRAAYSSLSSASSSPGFSVSLLHVILSNFSDPVRRAAAAYFKNHLRSHWLPLSENPIPEHEKQLIKSLLVSFVLAAPQLVQPQLSESLSLVSLYDFPQQWPSILPEIVSALNDDYGSAKGILSVADSLFRKFRCSHDNNYYDLKYCVDNFAAPLFKTFSKTSHLITSNVAGEPETLQALFELQRLCCEIFLSLNSVELTDIFKDHMKEWMKEFLAYLRTSYSPEIETEGTVDALRAVICENLQFCLEKNEEDFRVYLNDFVPTVLALFASSRSSPLPDKLTVTAIKFLTTVSMSSHHAVFVSTRVSQIFQSVISPNFMISKDDEELFKMNNLEYVKRDIEGSDVDTKRRIACEFLKGIALKNKEQVIRVVKTHIEKSLNSYRSNPAGNWKKKCSCIYLVVALAPKGDDVFSYLVDVDSFYTNSIVPELKAQDVQTFPMLKAAALKFCTVFREKIPKTEVLLRLDDLARFLVSESNVVHSYAANCIEKLLVRKVKEKSRGSKVIVRKFYSAADINPVLPLLMQNLFSALKQQKLHDNPYIMKCIMRIIGAGNITGATAKICIHELSEVLVDSCRKPKNPTFTHYLLEAIAALIGDARSGNVPASVCMLKAFLQNVPIDLNDDGILDEVLRVFAALIAIPKCVELSFDVLITVVENIGSDALIRHSVNIWRMIYFCLDNQSTSKLLECLVIFLSRLLIKHGPGFLVQSLDSTLDGLFRETLRYWIANMYRITRPIEVKLVSVAATRLICESSVLSDLSNGEVWAKMLNSIVKLLAQPAEQEALEDDVKIERPETMGCSAAFALLHDANQKEEDTLEEINDPKQVLVTSLATFSAKTPGHYPLLIKKYVVPANQDALLQLCSTYKCDIV